LHIKLIIQHFTLFIGIWEYIIEFLH